MNDVILDKCLEDMRAHRASLADCLAKYPEVADELAPLLEIAQAIEAVPDVQPSAAFKRRTREQILPPLRIARPATLNRPSVAPKFGLRPRFSFATVAFALIVILALTAGMVYASGDSLPGSRLYPIKRGAEQVQLLLVTDPESQARLHMALADRRLAETSALAQSNQSIFAEQSVNEYTNHLNAALAAIQSQPAQKESPLARELVGRLQRQQNELRALPQSSPAIQDALSASQKALDKLNAIPATPSGLPAAQPTRPPGTSRETPTLPAATPAIAVPLLTVTPQLSKPTPVPPGPTVLPSPKPYPFF